MKKGFTLVEMLIVVTVLVTLMAITFRLGSIGGTSADRNQTVAHLQRLENCLSGYYAAFGTYPPVKLHGSRNYKLSVSSHGIQNVDGEEEDLNWSWAASHRNGQDTDAEQRDWQKVEAACKAQPVDCRFPYPEGYRDFVDAISQDLQSNPPSNLSEDKKKVFSAGFDDGVSNNRGRHAQNMGESDWREIQLFKFGLMSYLLPRYLVMMNSAEELYEDYAQWTGNNSLPADPLTGQTYNNWQSLRDKAVSDKGTDLARVANIPSQAVCSRWMPNLEGVCSGNRAIKLFGVQITTGTPELRPGNTDFEVYSPGGFDNDSTSGQYVLDGVTILDGWEREFYYYSPAPYQSYVLWSAGPNKRTFPPWVSRDSLGSQANECIGLWVEDDIVSMSN
jgi:prepilin-type N-terminal cleavage/methylation domain-containing protein